jgi:hypothetical protein
MKLTLPLALLLALGSSAAQAAPKYGPYAQPLSRRTDAEYFRKSAAPDYWALAPYYLPQPTERACSATNLTLVLNAARSTQDLRSDQKLLTVASFAKDYTDPAYAQTVMGDGKFDRAQVTNRNLAHVLEQAVEKLKLKGPKTAVELVNVDPKNPEQSRKQFHQALVANEKSADDFIFMSFVQGVLTGDPEGGAHVATVGAYDAQRKLVLIMDPDREWYEPYWSPEDKVFDAIRDPRSDGLNPGWIHFQVR